MLTTAHQGNSPAYAFLSTIVDSRINIEFVSKTLSLVTLCGVVKNVINIFAFYNGSKKMALATVRTKVKDNVLRQNTGRGGGGGILPPPYAILCHVRLISCGACVLTSHLPVLVALEGPLTKPLHVAETRRDLHLQPHPGVAYAVLERTRERFHGCCDFQLPRGEYSKVRAYVANKERFLEASLSGLEPVAKAGEVSKIGQGNVFIQEVLPVWSRYLLKNLDTVIRRLYLFASKSAG